ncbi:LOW QUALITY PROTEIN: la-related protein 6C [Pistacia vera]|uniref:LOW QUALITY PROTEIN: la-related protein 6C n=1 Tax=Pistacia vera TaxID=55513 RepID=UPI001263B45C|nr:LOW QUALITY PROTEIN: la-related protein 6C [Pistacia vera]
MAQAQAERIEEKSIQEKEGTAMKNRNGSSKNNGSTSSGTVPFKFNAQAPEFVPRSQTQMPISGYYYPCFHYLGGTVGASDWIFVGDQEPVYAISNPNVTLPNSPKNVLTDDLKQKIIKQVEYQFSDMSLLANETLSKHINKDPEGYVPISVLASMKKIKSLVGNNQMLPQALRSSSKLVLSDDGKKVRRKHPFTEKEKEELQVKILEPIITWLIIKLLFEIYWNNAIFCFVLQSRTVVAENLPEDHSHQNLEKIFSVVGRVKTIRICHPPEINSSRSKCDFFVSNKLHALVEYENSDIAEKAVDKLNDERNWRKGLRVRPLLRCSPKSVLKNRKSEFDGILDDEEDAEDTYQLNHPDLVIENNAEEHSMGSKKGWARGRGKGRGRGQTLIGRGLLAPSPQSSSAAQSEAYAKQTSKGPRMPDGTRGFVMGRGKPSSSPALAASS